MQTFFLNLPFLTRYESCITSPLCYRHQWALWERKKILIFIPSCGPWTHGLCDRRVFQGLSGSAGAGTQQCWGSAVLSTAASTPKRCPWGRFSRGIPLQQHQYKHWKSQLRHSPHLLCTDHLFLDVLIHPPMLSLLLQTLELGTEIPWDAEFPEPAGRVDGAGPSSGWNLGSPVPPGMMLHQRPNTGAQWALSGARPSVNLLFLLKC